MKSAVRMIGGALIGVAGSQLWYDDIGFWVLVPIFVAASAWGFVVEVMWRNIRIVGSRG